MAVPQPNAPRLSAPDSLLLQRIVNSSIDLITEKGREKGVRAASVREREREERGGSAGLVREDELLAWLCVRPKEEERIRGEERGGAR
eukprot:3934480-Rhodomonas_salina.1